MSVLAVVSDLFFVAKVNEAAKTAGVTVHFATTEGKVWEFARDRPSLVIIDLNFSGIKPIQLISQLRSRSEFAPAAIVGFVSHVQVDVQRAALEAGCDLVLPRSALSRELPELVKNPSKKTGGI